MAFGLNDSGFNIKRLEDIKLEIEADLRGSLGEGINLEDNAPLGQIVGIFAEREALLWELAEAVYNSQFPDSAEGVSLDNSNALVNVPRLGAVKSIAVVRARGTATTVIPAGSIVSVDGDSTARFVTELAVTIAAAVNAEQKITFSAVPDSGNFTITFDSQTTGAILFSDNAATVESELEGLSNITSVTVTGNFTSGFTIEFDGADAGAQKEAFTTTSNLLLVATPVTITTTVIDEGGAYIDVQTVAETAGATQALAGTLTVIETLVSGWDSVDNLEDATVGRDIETDEEYSLRRTESLQQAASGTVEAIKNKIINDVEDVITAIVVENDSLVEVDGIPAKSFETVVQGGDEQDIAEAIFDVKAAGITAFGTINKTVSDSQGIDHNIGFSRPIDIDIYIDVTVTENTAGTITDTEVKNALLAYGDTLGIGDDVVVYPDMVASLVDLAINDVVLKVGIAPAPTLDNNIIIAVDEIAQLDSSRIAVTIL